MACPLLPDRTMASTLPVPQGDPVQAARAAGLHYADDAGPGITRRRAGTGFGYRGPDGKRVTDQAEPPEDPQARDPARLDRRLDLPGRPRSHPGDRPDARGRKQYPYHERWREVRDGTKYARRPPSSASATTSTRSRTARRPDHNARRARRGDRNADPVQRLDELPGQHLFQYLEDDGELRPVDSDDVNAYLREITGADFTAKDFRTWAGVLAARALVAIEPYENEAQAKRNLVAARNLVAQ